MPSTWVHHTELAGVSRLFGDFSYHFDRVLGFYAFSPRESASYTSAAAAVRYPDERRRALVDALAEQNADQPSLDLLGRPGTCVVATGQQVGLFSGPAYTIYKALTAAKLARQLTAQGIPSVPVFWLATEDHDFAEINHCWVFDAAHRAVRIEAGGTTGSQEPVGRIPIAGNPSADLRRALSGLPFGDEVAALVEEAYAEGRTYGEAFRVLLQRLLPAYDLLYLDPLQPAVRELAAPLLARAAAGATGLVRSVLERNRELESAGYHAQVHVDQESSLLFLLDGGRRLPLRSQGNGYIAAARHYSASELAGRAADLSPNALLRPVVQDYLLPTVASVLGPAELAYMAQAQVLYRELLDKMPVAVNRASFTLVDGRASRLMTRYGLSLADCARGREVLAERIARTLIPPELERSLKETATETGARLERLIAELTSFDPTLAEAAGRSRRKILHQIEKIGRKAGRESLRRDARAAAEAEYLSALLYPENQLQERLYSILPLLAQHGLGLIETLYENLQPGSPDHQLLMV